MTEEPIVCGDGFIGQLEYKDPPMEFKMSDLIECARQVFQEEAKKTRQTILYTGGTIYYGYGCKTLAHVHYARICAIKEKKMWAQYFGISKQIRFNYAPVERIRQPWTRRRGKKNRR